MADPAEDIIVEIEDDEQHVDPETGNLEIPTADGGVIIQFGDYRQHQDRDDDDDLAEFNNENLVESLTDTEQSQIVEELLEQIEADNTSRQEWLDKHAEAMIWLGLTIDVPRAGDVGASSAPAEGMSTYVDPLLLDAVVRAQATGVGELLPASGPVKVKQVGRETQESDAEARDLETDLNHWLTDVAKEYYPDTKRMLFWTDFAGAGFKKGYHCPIRRRPVIESVKAQDLIVSSDTTDFTTATRITHKINIRKSTMKRLMALKHYVQIDLPPPAPAPKDTVTDTAERIQGQRTGEERMEDRPYPAYESYAEIAIDELAPEDFKGTGIMLPWVVTIDIENRRMLSLRRDWAQDDPVALRRPSWVRYPYLEALGFYGLGLMHLAGNTTIALSAGMREGLDTGMLANFPAFLLAKWASRQDHLNIRLGPTEAQTIDTGDRPISDAIMGLPYKDVTQGLLKMMEMLKASGEKLANSAELPIQEGVQNAPVGSVVAAIEQATKVETAVHKGQHTAQAEEFQILVRLLREDPGAFVRHRRDMARQWDEDSFVRALENYGLEPVSDPNTPSHIHRLMRVTVLEQLSEKRPDIYDARAVHRRILTEMRYDDVDSLFIPPQPQGQAPPDPKLITAQARAQDSQTKEKKLQIDAAKVGIDSTRRMQELAAEDALEDKRIQKELIIHGDEHALEQQKHRLDVGQAVAGHGLDVASHGLDVAGHNADVAQAHAAHGLAVSEHGLDHQRHGLERSEHALDLHQALHDAMMDVHGLNQPEKSE